MTPANKPDPVTAAMEHLYEGVGPGTTYPLDSREQLSLFLATEFRDRLIAAERAIADGLPPVSWSALGEALTADGYVRTVYGLRRLGAK